MNGNSPSKDCDIGSDCTLRLRQSLTWFFLLGCLVPSAEAAAVTSLQDGPWTAAASWSSGAPPGASDEVTLQAGHTITVDTTSATCSTLTVRGTLIFSRATHGTLTMVGGNLLVVAGGKLDMGTAASPIPSSVRAHLVLAYGTFAGEYGLIISDGGNFTVHGATKSPYGFAAGNVASAASGLSISAAEADGWATGDIIAIGATRFIGPNPTETRAVTAVSGGDPKTISWGIGDPLFHLHLATGPTVVANITRNVLVRSSGTQVTSGGNSAYIRTLTQSATSFHAAHGEFASLGANLSGRYGITLDDIAAKVDITSCSVRDGYEGLRSQGASALEYRRNVFHQQSSFGIRISAGSSNNTVAGNTFLSGTKGLRIEDGSNSNVVRGNQFTSISAAIEVSTASMNHIEGNSFVAGASAIAILESGSTSNVILANRVYAPSGGGIRIEGSSNRVSSNSLIGIIDANHSGVSITAEGSNQIISSNSLVLGAISGFGSRILIASNSVFSSGLIFPFGISWGGSHSRLEYNYVPCAVCDVGMRILGSSNSVIANEVTQAKNAGVDVAGHGNLFSANRIYANGSVQADMHEVGGVRLTGSSNVFVTNAIYSNLFGVQSAGLAEHPSNLFSNTDIGFDLSGSPAPNSSADFHIRNDTTSAQNIELRNVRMNPSVGISTSGLNSSGRHIVSFNQNQDTGTVRIYGDYLVSGTDLSLWFDSALRPSTATVPSVVFGNSIAAVSVNSTADDAAVTQLVGVVFRGADSLWHVVGSVSGDMGSLPPTGGTANFPTLTPQFSLTLSASGAQDGDRADFALLAASGDANRQKKLLFARGADQFRGGRAKLTVAPDGGLSLRGAVSIPTISDRVDATMPYYSLVSSGAFSAAMTSFTNVDSAGLQLSGSAGVSVSSSTFDFMGVSAGVANAYITANGLTSKTTFYSTVFATSRSTAGASPARNVRVLGSNPGLEWYFRGKGGPLWGEAFEDDSAGRVVWWDRPPANPSFLVIQTSSITGGWGQVFPDRYELHAATAADFSGTVDSSITFAVDLTTLSLAGLTPNTTYFLRVGAAFVNGIEYAAFPATATLAKAVTGAAISAVHFSSVALNWVPLPTAALEGSSNSAQGYRLHASTMPDFSGQLFSVGTSDVQQSTLVVTGLTVDVTYFFRVGTLNWRGTPNFVSAGLSAIPAPLVPSGLQAAAVFQTSVTLNWSGGANPGGTRYEISLSTDAFAAHFSTPIGFSTGLTVVSTGLTGLAPATTHQFRVRAQSPGGTVTDFAPIFTTVTIPSGLPAPTGAALGISSISWTWSNAGPAASYRLHRPDLGTLVAMTTVPFLVQTGLQTDSATGLLVEPFTAAGTGGLSPPTTRFTFAESPANPIVSVVSSGSVTLGWSTQSNPAGFTRYEVSASTDNFTLNFSTPAPISSNTTVSTASAQGLAAGTTYSFRIRAVNGDGLFTGFSQVIATQTLPGTVSSLVGNGLGVSSISWSWSATAGLAVTSYDVFRASNGVLLANATGTVFVDTSLSTNVAYGVIVAARNGAGLGALSAAATTFTLAAPPTGVAITGVFTSSTALSWSANLNPFGTVFEIQRSTDNAAFSASGAVVSASHVVTGLTGPSTHYFRVRALSGASVATAFAATVSTFVFGTPPSPPSGLAAASAGGLRIRLDWGPSPSTSVVRYNLYFDAGTGTINYSLALSTFAASATTFLSAPLTDGLTYRFGLRAQDNLGQEERNSSVQAAAVALASLTGVRAAIRAPAGGLKIAGDRLTVLAEIIQGSGIREVRFQYKASSVAVWSDIVPMTTHANPDSAAPYYVHWSVAGLASTDFDLRAIAVDSAGTPDGAPPSVTLRVDPVDFDLREFAIAGGRIQLEKRVFSSVANTLHAAEAGSALVTKLVLPAGALAASTGTVTLVNNPVALPADGAEVHGAGVAADISLSGGQTTLAGGNLAILTFAYADENKDGLVDGTLIRADGLAVYAFDVPSGKWRKEAATTLDTVGRTVSATTSHFSFFGAFVPAHADLASLRVFPNPYKPNNASADDGTPHSPGSPNSGIIFDNLPDQVTIKIFTVSAQLVREISSGASGGRVQWDVKNDRGADVASGGYFALINSPGQKAVVKRLGIVR